LHEKIQQLSFINPSHLDIDTRYWNYCYTPLLKKELMEIDILVPPEQKLQKIIKASSIIIELMRLSGDAFPAIDDFLPLLIYNIIKINPPRLHSNIKFVIFKKLTMIRYIV